MLESLYFDQYDRVNIGLPNGQQNLNAYFAEKLPQLAINYSAGLVKFFAETVDSQAPTFTIREESLNGNPIGPDGYSRANAIAVKAWDMPVPKYPGRSGVYRVVLTQTSGGTYTSTRAFAAEDVFGSQGFVSQSFPNPDDPNPPAKLSEGQYVVQVKDGLANETTAGFTTSGPRFSVEDCLPA